jgi:hypothetical protein
MHAITTLSSRADNLVSRSGAHAFDVSLADSEGHRPSCTKRRRLEGIGDKLRLLPTARAPAALASRRVPTIVERAAARSLERIPVTLQCIRHERRS